MTPLTALDLAGIRFTAMGHARYAFDCPVCGSLAWAGRAHMQCTGRECRARVFEPLDLLVSVWRDSFSACEERSAALIGREPSAAHVAERQRARLVLTTWLSACGLPDTGPEILLADKFSKAGLSTSHLQASGTFLSAKKLNDLLDVADATGATYSEKLREKGIMACFAYCVQSIPHTIDRIVVIAGKTAYDVTWHRRRAGLSGLLSVVPSVTQFLAASKTSALKLQNTLRRLGHTQTVMSVFYDQGAEFTENHWAPDASHITAVVDRIADVVDIQKALDQFPGMESVTTATTTESLVDIKPSLTNIPWHVYRISTIKQYNGPRDRTVHPNSAYLFEQTGSRSEDAAQLVELFTRAGNLDLADSVRKMAENRTIYTDATCKILETYNSYRIFTKHDARDVANFSLKLQASVIFGDVNSEVYYKALVGHGNRKTPALISRPALESVRHLQQELQIVAADGDAVIPTVTDVGQMRSKVMPYLATQASRLPVVRGISCLGWSSDRRTFQTPGRLFSIDGVRKGFAAFHPAVYTLRPYVEVMEWSESCPDIPKDAQTLVAMMLALTVRSYKRCAVRPIRVAQTSDTLTLLNGIMRGIGQTSILELNANARDVRMQYSGISGYPCVAAGYSNQQISQSNVPFTILTDEGFMVSDEIDPHIADNAGRALQFAMTRVTEWCLATQADEFREIPSTDWHNSLSLEGQWLMEHVCQLQPWEVRIKEISELENLFSQIPLDKVQERMVLLNGTILRLDCVGLEINQDGVARECEVIGAPCTLRDKALFIPAAPIITAIHRYYGCDPGIKAVLA